MTQIGRNKKRIVGSEKEPIGNIPNEKNTEIIKKIIVDESNSNLETKT